MSNERWEMPKYGHAAFLIAGILTLGLGWVVWAVTVLIQDDHNAGVEFRKWQEREVAQDAWYAARKEEYLKKKGLK